VERPERFFSGPSRSIRLGALNRSVDLEFVWQAFEIAGD
jgi:hypothetical protein